MSFSIVVNFAGNCREAVTFYAEVFSQDTPTFLTYAESNTAIDPNVEEMSSKDKVAFTSLNIAGTYVEFCDMPDNFEFVRGNSISLTVIYSEMLEAQKVFSSLSTSGHVVVPLTEIPGQSWYGMLIDKFGLVWTVKVLN